MPGYGMPEYGMPGATPAAKFNPLGYRILLTRRRIAHEMLLVKRGLLGPDATLKTSSAAAAAAAAKTSPTAKAGLSALAKAGADQTAVDDALNGIDTIVKVVEQSTFNEMKALVEELRGKVRQMEDKCGIVVELEEEPVPGATLDNPLANPLDVPAGIPGLEIPSVPAEPPAAAPPGTVPAGQPAAAAPEVRAPCRTGSGRTGSRRRSGSRGRRKCSAGTANTSSWRPGPTRRPAARCSACRGQCSPSLTRGIP